MKLKVMKVESLNEATFSKEKKTYRRIEKKNIQMETHQVTQLQTTSDNGWMISHSSCVHIVQKKVGDSWGLISKKFGGTAGSFVAQTILITLVKKCEQQRLVIKQNTC